MTSNPHSNAADDPFVSALDDLEHRHLRRSLRVVETACDATVSIDGRRVILMASNNYLGLATHPKVKRAALDAIERFGAGAGASRLISGTQGPHVELERELSRFKNCEAALCFGSGYLANLGLIAALAKPGDLILADRLCHASLIDGCRLSGAALRVFRHNDVAQVARLLARNGTRRRVLVVTEGIFSMDGDAAPLGDLAKVTQAHGARLLVDDAHGAGVMGGEGRGTVEMMGLDPGSLIQMGTLSKALGASGAYVVGSGPLIDYLINTARSFIYSTALPPAMAAAAQAALRVVQAEPERRARLWTNRRYLYDGLKAAGFRMTESVSPILPVLVGDPETAVAAGRRLLDQGVFAPAIRPPTIPQGTSRIRLTVTAEHRTADLDHVLAAFTQIGQELGLVP